MEYSISTPVLQTNQNVMPGCTVIYAVKKRPLLEDIFRSRMPIKIQRFTKTPDEKKLIINKMTKLP